MKIKKIHNKKYDIYYYLTKELYDICNNIKLSLSTFAIIKNKHGIDFFDIGEFGNISYLSPNKITIINNNDIKYFKNKYRQEMKIGRMITKSSLYTSNQIERYTNKYKTEQKILNGEFDKIFKIVEGEDIKYWYNEKNYKHNTTFGNNRVFGQLGNSCMRNVKSYRFNIYSKNPKVCKMILLLDNNKLTGRALLWKTNKGWYIDRPYCVSDNDRYLYKRYANYKNYLFYDNDKYKKMSVKLKKRTKLNKHKNPWMDTFYNYNFIKNTLSTNESKFSIKFRTV